MADPFEVRMRFTAQLRDLNASVSSAQKAAQYALRHRDMDEDLHSCILEQLEKSNLNVRANIMYFLEQFLDLAHKDGNREYVRMIQRDIIRVVDAVAPDDGSGAANVRVVRKVLQNLHAKGYLETQAVTQIEEVIKERETTAEDMGIASPDGDVEMGDAPPSKSRKEKAGPHGLDKYRVEQRLEEDRERHKRERESMWAVGSDGDEELNKLWGETSEFGEDDDRLIVEEAEEFEKEMEMEMEKCPHQHKGTNGNGARA